MNKQLVIDQMQRTVEFPSTVLRIVSIVPSQTELLVDLGLRDKLVGVTKFCVHPEDLRKNVTVVGGTKQVDLEKVRALKPDIIIGNKEENDASNIRDLEQIAPVWMSDIFDLNDALNMIDQFGKLFKVESKATQIATEIQANVKACTNVFKDLPKRVHYFIWRKPYMVAGKNTFIHAVLTHLGLVNIEGVERYPEVNVGQIHEAVDLVFLSSEPYPFGPKHFEEFQTAYPNAQIILVDGEMFSWYGSRLQKLNAYVHEELLPQINGQKVN